MANIALLEDEVLLRKELAAFLGKRGHQVSQAGSLAEFWPLPAATDIAILDLMLPDGSGLDAASRLRQQFPRLGIIMLTALGATQDKLAGLGGAPIITSSNPSASWNWPPSSTPCSAVWAAAGAWTFSAASSSGLTVAPASLPCRK